VAQTRWQQAGGYGFSVKKPLTPEAIMSKWNAIINFSGSHVHVSSQLNSSLTLALRR